MKIKRYFAKDVRTAIQMVRDDQGPDAVIMSNTKVDGGVEIVAAIEYDESIFASNDGQAVRPVPKEKRDIGKYSEASEVRDVGSTKHHNKKHSIDAGNNVSHAEISDLKSRDFLDKGSP